MPESGPARKGLARIADEDGGGGESVLGIAEPCGEVERGGAAFLGGEGGVRHQHVDFQTDLHPGQPDVDF